MLGLFQHYQVLCALRRVCKNNTVVLRFQSAGELLSAQRAPVRRYSAGGYFLVDSPPETGEGEGGRMKNQ